MLSPQKEFDIVDNVVIQEPLGSSDHNQLYFNIKYNQTKQKLNNDNVRGSLGNVSIYLYGTLTLSILTITQRHGDDHGVVSSKCSVCG